jgi:hypothetical protein
MTILSQKQAGSRRYSHLSFKTYPHQRYTGSCIAGDRF